MKKTKLLITMMIMALIALPLVFAASTMTSPVTGGNYTETVSVSLTIATNGEDNMTNATCYQDSAGGAATTFLVEILNSSVDDTDFTDSVSISALAETSTYNITCDIYNGTTLNDTISVLGVTFDSTNPVCSLIRQSPKPPYKGIQQVDWTSTDTLELMSTAITIDRPQSGSDMTYTDANRELTLLSTDTGYIGDWTATITGTDRPGNTCTESVTWKTYLPNGEYEEYYEEEEQKAKNKNTLIVIIILVGLGWFFLGSKK